MAFTRFNTGKKCTYISERPGTRTTSLWKFCVCYAKDTRETAKINPQMSQDTVF